MTKHEARTKCRELLRQTHNGLMAHIDVALNCGALELSDYDDDYALPKIIVTALLREAVWQWKPLDRAAKETVLNLQHLMNTPPER